MKTIITSKEDTKNESNYESIDTEITAQVEQGVKDLKKGKFIEY